MSSNSSSSIRAVALGNAIKQTLQTINSKYSKEAREEFLQVHEKLEEAAGRVDPLEMAVKHAIAKVDAADKAQDARTLALADLLSADGFGRRQPFQPFGVASPGALTGRIASSAQARLLISLANKVLVHPRASAASKKAAHAMQEAAVAVQGADSELTMALDARIKAVRVRNQTAPAWQKALSRLRASLRYGDFEEGTQHYETVFRRVARAFAPKRKQAVIVPDASPGGPVS